MRLKLDVEIPQWSQWLAGGLAIGLVFGVGAARVYADPITVKTDWKPGEPLTAEELNKTLKTLQDELNRQEDALNRLQNQDCPPGYVRDAVETVYVVCKKGKDEVVKVGGGNAAFWVDRYEASIWQNADGSGDQYGLGSPSEYSNAGFPENGQYTTPRYALSVAGVQPSAYMTWFQAKAACRLSGKRLPNGEEWLEAALNTPDPGAHAGTGGFCATNAAEARKTGGGTLCRSRWGADDMIGNYWEWTADWYAGVGDGAGVTTTWTRPESFQSDMSWNISSSAQDGAGFQVGLPSASLRGGSYLNGVNAGVFSLTLGSAPSSNQRNFGLRCIIPR